MQERDFVMSTKENEFDFLVSDGDHNHAGEWVEDIFRIMKPDSFMFSTTPTTPDTQV